MAALVAAQDHADRTAKTEGGPRSVQPGAAWVDTDFADAPKGQAAILVTLIADLCFASLAEAAGAARD